MHQQSSVLSNPSHLLHQHRLSGPLDTVSRPNFRKMQLREVVSDRPIYEVGYERGEG